MAKKQLYTMDWLAHLTQMGNVISRKWEKMRRTHMENPPFFIFSFSFHLSKESAVGMVSLHSVF